MNNWTNKYIGCKGDDCFQLVNRVLHEEFGAEPYPGDSWVETDTRLPGNVVSLTMRGLPIHCGLLVTDKIMLHTLAGNGACLERLSPVWDTRIAGVYRRRSMANE